jgi:outer membrane protein assembly factor BamB
LLAASCPGGGDASEWRGPDRNGVLRGSPPILASLEGDDLELLWERPLPEGGKPHYASPVGAAGRVYLHLSPAGTPPPPEPEKAPAVKPAPKAEPALGGLLDVDDDDEGLGGLGMQTPGIKRPDPPAAGPGRPRRPRVTHVDDMLLCVDLATGNELWCFRRPAGRTTSLGAPNTPCVRNGRVFFVGNAGTVYALDAVSGEECWRAEAGAGSHAASPAVVDGRLVVADRCVQAFSVADGARLWKADVAVAHGSPVPWERDGRRLVVVGGPELACIDAADGRVLWRLPGNKGSASPVVSGSLAVMMYAYGPPTVYRMSLEGAEKLGDFPIAHAGMGHQACTPCIDGARLYAWDRNHTFCYDLERGDFAWKGEAPGDGKPSPLLADGKVIGVAPGRALVLDARTGRTLVSARIAAQKCTSCGLADARLLVNAGRSLRCYDLAAAAAAAADR